MQALDAYDNHKFEESLRYFDQIADTSKILFNCGVIYATLGEHDKAVRPTSWPLGLGVDHMLTLSRR